MNSTPLHTGTTTSTDQPGSLAPHSNDRRPHPPSHFPPAKPQDAPPQKTRHPAPNPRTRPETAIPGDDRTKLARMGEGRDPFQLQLAESVMDAPSIEVRRP